MTDPIELVGKISASMEQMKTDNAAAMAAITEASKSAGADAKAAIEKADELAKKVIAGSEQIRDLEQKLAEGVKAGKAAPETLGRMVIKSDAYKSFASGNQSKMSVMANTITGQSGSPASNSDVIVAPDRLSGIVGGAYRSLRIRDVLPSGVTTSNMVEYTRELAFTNNAAETAEGATKPESVLTFELASAKVATIAHWLKVSKQVLEDSAVLESYINNRLRYGVEKRYDEQLLKGNGTGQNISGIIDGGNFTAFTPEIGETALDSLNRMIEAVATADYAATGIIMHPADWHKIERLKVGTADARYVIGNPSGAMMPMIWGLPVVVTTAMTSGSAVVGAFDISHQIFDRVGVQVDMSESDDTNFQKNLLTVRAEARGCLATYRPASVYSGALVV
jgi:HK97 family phage major capsid protein